jgi:hypothetical protein
MTEASVLVTAIISTSAAAAAASATASLSGGILATSVSLQTALTDAGVSGTVVSAPTVGAAGDVSPPIETESAGGGGLPTEALIGIGVAAGVIVLILVVVACLGMRRKSGQSAKTSTSSVDSASVA